MQPSVFLARSSKLSCDFFFSRAFYQNMFLQDVAQLVECLISILAVLSLVPVHKLGIVVPAVILELER